MIARKMEKQTGGRSVSVENKFVSPAADEEVLSALCRVLKREFPDSAVDIFQSVVRVSVGGYTSCRCFSENPHDEQV
jgi:hypothetical protein